MITPKLPNDNNKYVCKICDYTTCKTSSYKKHILTVKHQMLSQGYTNVSNHICDCGKQFKHRQGLYRHKRTCTTTERDSSIELSSSNKIDKDDLIIELLKENRDFKQLLIDQNKQMMELSQNAGNNNNINCNNNSNNKFNLNVFLNEKCKDAISLKDFVDSMNITLEEYIHTGEMGYIEGISKNIVKRINDMGVYDRPIHCTDLKRETIYIKDGEKWEKDDDKSELRKAVKRVAHKNHKMTTVWMENTHDVNTIGTENYEKFFKYMQSTLGGCGEKETKSFEDKIMRNIMKEVTIDKQAEERS